MKIIITENQLNTLKEVNYISKDELQSKASDDKIDVNLLGIYTIKDMDKFYELPPYKQLKRFKTHDQNYADSSKEAGWKRVTEYYPVVVVDIPFNTARKKNYNTDFFKNARNKESYSHTDNNLFIIFTNRGKDWIAEKFWIRKGNQDIFKFFQRAINGKNPHNVIDGLVKGSYFNIDNPYDAYDNLIKILYNVPKTNPNDVYMSDDDIDREFREPIRFTLRNGQDPKTIVDKILNKYGRLSKDINRMISGDGPDVRKFPKKNPYLD